MQVTVEDVNSVKKILHIEIPAKTVTKELDKAYRELKKNAKIKGFRPGKAPRSVLERLFQKDVHGDVSSRLIQESLLKSIQDEDLKIVGSPKVDPPAMKPQEPYAYDATVEINPEIADIDYKGLELTQTKYEVDDGEIEAQLKMIQKSMARQEPIEEKRPLTEGDYALITYEGFKDGQPFSDAPKMENFTAKVGEKNISPEFDEALVGLQAGETKEFAISFADDYENEKWAGLDLEFKVELNEIRQEILPPMDDSLAKELGRFESVAELRTEIRNNLEQGYAKRVEQELNEHIYKALLEKIDFEVPEVLVEYELEAILDETERTLSYQGQSMEQMGMSRDVFADKYRDTAFKQVKRQLILNKLIEQEELKASDEEVENGYQDMAESMNRPLQEIKDYYRQNSDKLTYFKHALLEKKAIKLIMDNSAIQEKAPETESPTDDAPADDTKSDTQDDTPNDPKSGETTAGDPQKS